MDKKEMHLKLKKILTELNEIVADEENFKQVYGEIYSNMDEIDPFTNGFIVTKKMIENNQKYADKSKIDFMDIICVMVEDYLY